MRDKLIVFVLSGLFLTRTAAAQQLPSQKFIDWVTPECVTEKIDIPMDRIIVPDGRFKFNDPVVDDVLRAVSLRFDSLCVASLDDIIIFKDLYGDILQYGPFNFFVMKGSDSNFKIFSVDKSRTTGLCNDPQEIKFEFPVSGGLPFYSVYKPRRTGS